MSAAPNLAKLSRREAETLCLLDAVARGGRTAESLTGRLGLSLSLWEAVDEVALSLVFSGLLERPEGGYSLSEAGREKLTQAKAQLSAGP